MIINDKSYIKNIIIIILRYLGILLRNSLFLPYATLLILYLSLISIIILSLFLSNDIGIDFINSIITKLYEWNIIHDGMENINKNYTSEQTSKFIVSIIIIFSIVFDLFSRVIMFLNKKMTRWKLQRNLIKLLAYFYLITTILSILIILFTIKDLIAFIFLFFFLFLNVISGLFAFFVNYIYGKIIESIDKKN